MKLPWFQLIRGCVGARTFQLDISQGGLKVGPSLKGLGFAPHLGWRRGISMRVLTKMEVCVRSCVCGCTCKLHSFVKGLLLPDSFTFWLSAHSFSEPG